MGAAGGRTCRAECEKACRDKLASDGHLTLATYVGLASKVAMKAHAFSNQCRVAEYQLERLKTCLESLAPN